MRMAEPEHFDVLVVGAGLSGVAAGYHLQDKCPGKELRHSREP
jgi:monooxygenase